MLYIMHTISNLLKKKSVTNSMRIVLAKVFEVVVVLGTRGLHRYADTVSIQWWAVVGCP